MQIQTEVLRLAHCVVDKCLPLPLRGYWELDIASSALLNRDSKYVYSVPVVPAIIARNYITHSPLKFRGSRRVERRVLA